MALTVQKKGIGSIEQIIDDVASGVTTLKSVINELLVLGYIEEVGDKVQFVMNPFKMTSENSQALESVSFTLDHCIT